ncbi:uncharacterized protein [Musca autumnalis]|uniref:uncharacterized protein n=1 Tax=Musca autumnalis TaxID=221902 RepID=UPI003CF75331
MSSPPQQKCRTCLCEQGNEKLNQHYYNLDDYIEAEEARIMDMLDDMVPQIKIKEEINILPRLVCQNCVDKLLNGHRFQQLCIESNKYLLACLNSSQAVQDNEAQDKQELMNVLLDPLTGVEDVKLKQELEEEVENYQCITNAEDLEFSLKSDKEWEDELADEGGGSAGGGFEKDDSSDTDSSNEKLSVLKQRKLRKTRSHLEESEEKPRNPAGRKSKDKPAHTCTVCGKIFSLAYRLERHSKVHQHNRAFPCDICKLSFATEKTYRCHMQLKHKEVYDADKGEEFPCPICSKTFWKKLSLTQHMVAHNPNAKKRGRPSGKINKLKEEQNNEMELEKEAIQVDGEGKDSTKQDENLLEIQADKEVSEGDVKHEIEVTPQIFDTLQDYDDDEWFDQDEIYDDSEDDDEFVGKEGRKKPKYNPDLDYVDTGVGEVEKPSARNRRNGNFPCDICGKVFDRPYRLKRHLPVHSMERPHACNVCNYRFFTSNLLRIHMVQHENENAGAFMMKSRPDGFKCPDCPRRFEKQASLSAHRQIHTRNNSDVNYPCTTCQRNFMSVRSLTEHITNKHPEVEKHKCDQCDKTFVLHAHLVEHLNRHKGNKNFICLICEKEFGYTNTLKEHMRTHSGESPYLCPQCGKTFRSASNLRQHMERHFGLKKYQCPECPSRFNCRSDLCKHTSTHTNAKPHVCDICGSRFTRSYSLQKHKLLHSGERPFKCDQCSMTFAIIYHLRRHMRTHTGEKPYKCKYCDRAYAESGDLTKHLRTHVGENTYMCSECPMAFKYQSELRQHVSEHYKNSLQQNMHQDNEQQREDFIKDNQEKIQSIGQLSEQQQSHAALEIPLQHIEANHTSSNELMLSITNANHTTTTPSEMNLVDGC